MRFNILLTSYLFWLRTFRSMAPSALSCYFGRTIPIYCTFLTWSCADHLKPKRFSAHWIGSSFSSSSDLAWLLAMHSIRFVGFLGPHLPLCRRSSYRGALFLEMKLVLKFLCQWRQVLMVRAFLGKWSRLHHHRYRPAATTSYDLGFRMSEWHYLIRNSIVKKMELKRWR